MLLWHLPHDVQLEIVCRMENSESRYTRGQTEARLRKTCRAARVFGHPVEELSMILLLSTVRRRIRRRLDTIRQPIVDHADVRAIWRVWIATGEEERFVRRHRAAMQRTGLMSPWLEWYYADITWRVQRRRDYILLVANTLKARIELLDAGDDE